MKTLLACLFTIVIAVSQAQAADTQAAPAPQWFYLPSGWYLMVPADASHVAQATNGKEFPAAKALPAGVVPAAAPVVAITVPTIRIQRSAEPEATVSATPSSSGIWDVPTGNNSTSGSLGSMR